MKNLIFTLICAAGLAAQGQTNWTDSTNFDWASTTIDQVYIGTGLDNNGYTFKQLYGVINHDVNLLGSWHAMDAANIASNTAALALMAAGITNFSLTCTNTAYTNPPSMIVTSISNGVAFVLATIPAGAPGSTGPAGTNIITAYNFTNGWYSSFNNTLFATNNMVWGTSNFIGTFASGFSSLNFNGGASGASGISPSVMNVNQNVFASTNGDATWFLICTNGGVSTFTTTNSVDLSVSGAGGGLGELEVYLVDHPELINRSNGGYQQNYSFNDPVNPQDPATKNYTDYSIANSAGGQVFVRSTDTNGVTHSTLSVNGSAAIDITSSQNHLMRAWTNSGTNLLLYINLTNLTTGWSIQATTNLDYNYFWAPFTNWTSVTTNTVGGVSNTVTFTIPKTLPGTPMQYFDPRGQQSSGITLKLPTTMTFLTLTNFTVTSSTNSTLGLPVNTIFSDGNYLYRVNTTNLTATPTNYQRMPWPTNTW